MNLMFCRKCELDTEDEFSDGFLMMVTFKEQCSKIK